MRVVKFENKEIVMSEAAKPCAPEGEALVRVLMAGICGTDIELLTGYKDFSGIPGHEFAGVVESAPGAPELVGKRVAADINIGCGKCAICRAGNPGHCPCREVLGIKGRSGAFAEYLTLPLENLRVVPESVETIEAVFAEPLAAALEITRQVHITQKTRAAVIGDGKMGLLCALCLDHYAGSLAVFGRHREKLEILESRGIKTRCVNKSPLEEEDVIPEGGFDLVVDATGSSEGAGLALKIVRPRGIAAVKTTVHGGASVNISELVVKEAELIGSRCGDIGFALKFLERKWVIMAPLVEKVYPFKEFLQAFDHARQRGSRKVLLSFE